MAQAAVGSQAVIVKQKGCGNTKAVVDLSVFRVLFRWVQL
jgi:hypothetical protein